MGTSKKTNYSINLLVRSLGHDLFHVPVLPDVVHPYVVLVDVVVLALPDVVAEAAVPYVVVLVEVVKASFFCPLVVVLQVHHIRDKNLRNHP